MNKLLCVGLMCAVGASIIGGEKPKSGHSSLQSSPLRKSTGSLHSSSEAIAICSAAQTIAKRQKNDLSSSAGLSISSSRSNSSSTSPTDGENDLLFPGQRRALPRCLLPVDPKDSNMSGAVIWPYYR
jgi:hypothetical protein